MATVTHTGIFTLESDNAPGNPITYNFSGILKDRGRFVEGGFQFENNGPLFQLSFKTEGAIGVQDQERTLTRLTEFIDFPGGITVIFTNAVPQLLSYYPDTEKLTAEDFTCTIDDVQHSFGISILKDPIILGDPVGDGGAGVEAIEEIEVTPVKVRVNQILNQFDNLGFNAGVTRNDGETNFLMKERIRDGVQNRGGSSLRELETAIGRDLGFLYEKAINVKLKSDVTFSDFNDSMFLVSNGRLRIYSEWHYDGNRHILITKIEESNGLRFDFELKDYTLGQIVDLINKSSLYEARLTGKINQGARGLATYSSREPIRETIKTQDVGDFAYKFIREDTLTSHRPEIFVQDRTGVAGGLEITGDYTIDRHADDSTYYTLKDKSGFLVTFQYMAMHKEFDLKTNLVSLIELGSEASQDSLFNQIENGIYSSEEERFTNGIPNDDFFRLLKTVLNSGGHLQYWGE